MSVIWNLCLVHVALFASVPPEIVVGVVCPLVGFTLDGVLAEDQQSSGDLCAPLGAQDVVIIFIMTTGNLALAEDATLAIFVHVVHLNVVPDIARIIWALAATHGHAAVRRFIAVEP